MKIKYYLIGVSLFMLQLPYAQGSGLAANFEVDSVRVDRNGRGFVAFTSPLIDSPATCGSDYPNLLAFNTNTAGGRSILAVALTAKASDKKMRVRGTGYCQTYGVIEDWNWGRIVD